MCKNLTGAKGRAVNKLRYRASETQARESQSSALYWRLACLKQNWSLCSIGRGGTGSSAILIKQESVNRTNGFLRELGRNEMRSSYLYARCKGRARKVWLITNVHVSYSECMKVVFFIAFFYQ